MWAFQNSGLRGNVKKGASKDIVIAKPGKLVSHN